jgi:PAS domain S-box-containing protein
MPVGGIAALVWLPSGLSLAALYILGYRFWPAIAFGEFSANAFFGMPLSSACGMAIGNSLEAITGVYLLRKFVRFRTDLSSIRSVLGLIILAIPVSTVISATAGVTSLILTSKISVSEYWITWRAWWIGNVLGDFIVASLLFVWSSQRRSALRNGKVTEFLTLTTLVIGFTLWIFTRNPASPELYLIFCLIILAALRFSSKETVTLTFVISVIAISGTIYGRGPFSEPSISENLLLLQLFLGVLSATGMLLSAAVVERRDAEEKFKLVFASSPIAMTITDQNGKILIFNSKAENLFGYHIDEIIGHQIEMLIPEWHHANRNIFQPNYFSSLKTQPMGQELHGVQKDGVELRIELSVTPLQNPEGIQVLSSIIDITERKRDEVGLRCLSEAGITLSKSLDIKETMEKTVHFLLPKFADWCLLDLAENGAKQIAIAYPDTKKEMFLHELTTRLVPDPALGRGSAYVLHSGKSELYTDQTNDSDWIAETLGLVHPQILRELGVVSYMCVPLVARGRTLGTITYVNRISNCRYNSFYLTLAEEIANRAAIAIDNAQLFLDAQSATRMREYFLSVVSHDLKNPLFAISAGTSLLLDPQLPMEREVVQRIAEQMSKSVSRMDRLIHDLLDLAKLEANQLLIERHRNNSATLIEESISQIEIQIKRKGLNLVKDFARDSFFVSCDHDRSLQIIVNLLDNAVKFSPDSGTIKISTKRTGESIEFAISDTGPGLAQDQLLHVFDRYWQADRLSRRGSGLGLSIVSELVKAHGGKIWAESQPGQGTTFFFTLPAELEGKG